MFQTVEIHTTGFTQHRKPESSQVDNFSNSALDYGREDFVLQGLQSSLAVVL